MGNEHEEEDTGGRTQREEKTSYHNKISTIPEDKESYGNEQIIKLTAKRTSMKSQKCREEQQRHHLQLEDAAEQVSST